VTPTCRRPAPHSDGSGACFTSKAFPRPFLMLWMAPLRHESAIEVCAVRTSHDSEEPGHAKDYDGWSRYVFQAHGVDADGNLVFCRQLKRRCVLTFFEKLPPCPVGI